MLRKVLAPAFLAATLAVPAYAAVETIQAVDVEVDLTALANPEAATRYATLDDDLTNAITALLTDRFNGEEDGASIKIDVNEVSLQDQFEVATGLDASSLAATVNVQNVNNNTDYNTFDLTVTMAQAMPYIPQGVDVAVLTPSSDEVYNALVKTFAEAAVARIDG